MTGREIDHGTYAGAQAHRRRGEDACPDCRAARTAYVRAWRAENRDNAARHSATNNARNRALLALSKLHPEEFERLYAAELCALNKAREQAPT